jgi:hypothetical protein
MQRWLARLFDRDTVNPEVRPEKRERRWSAAATRASEAGERRAELGEGGGDLERRGFDALRAEGAATQVRAKEFGVTGVHVGTSVTAGPAGSRPWNHACAEGVEQP